MYSFKSMIIQNGFGRKTILQYNIKNIFVRNYTPRRALLYVPGDSEKKIAKALNMKVDCITMDCEDGVALTHKAKARETIRTFLNKGRAPYDKHAKDQTKPLVPSFDWAVRVNHANSPLIDEDLTAILTAKHTPDTIVLPKVNTAEDIRLFSDKFRNSNFTGPPMKLLLLIESAVAMLNLPHICQTCIDSNLFKINGLIFGSDDLCASIGALRTEDSREVMYARQKLVLVAKAYNLQAIDMVYIEYKDLFGFRNDCVAGMKMGYTGKQVIHPNQVPVAQESFLPTKMQVDWATGLITAFNEHQKKGIGAFSYKNSMIDMPTLKIARNIVELINKTKTSE